MKFTMKWYSRRPSGRKSVPPRRKGAPTPPEAVEPEPEAECSVCTKLLEECSARRKDPSVCWTAEPEPEPEPEVEEPSPKLWTVDNKRDEPRWTMDNKKTELLEAAAEVGVRADSSMTKQQILDALYDEG